MTTDRFVVDCMRHDCQRAEWGPFAAKKKASTAAARLAMVWSRAKVREIPGPADEVQGPGMRAMTAPFRPALELPSEAPEHHNDRRRFLIWALMVGAVKPERVVERVLAEMEGDDAGSLDALGSEPPCRYRW
jgi:hypothetical protein